MICSTNAAEKLHSLAVCPGWIISKVKVDAPVEACHWLRHSSLSVGFRRSIEDAKLSIVDEPEKESYPGIVSTSGVRKQWLQVFFFLPETRIW